MQVVLSLAYIHNPTPFITIKKELRGIFNIKVLYEAPQGNHVRCNTVSTTNYVCVHDSSPNNYLNKDWALEAAYSFALPDGR